MAQRFIELYRDILVDGSGKKSSELQSLYGCQKNFEVLCDLLKMKLNPSIRYFSILGIKEILKRNWAQMISNGSYLDVRSKMLRLLEDEKDLHAKELLCDSFECILGDQGSPWSEFFLFLQSLADSGNSIIYLQLLRKAVQTGLQSETGCVDEFVASQVTAAMSSESEEVILEALKLLNSASMPVKEAFLAQSVQCIERMMSNEESSLSKDAICEVFTLFEAVHKEFITESLLSSVISIGIREDIEADKRCILGKLVSIIISRTTIEISQLTTPILQWILSTSALAFSAEDEFHGSSSYELAISAVHLCKRNDIRKFYSLFWQIVDVCSDGQLFSAAVALSSFAEDISRILPEFVGDLVDFAALCVQSQIVPITLASFEIIEALIKGNHEVALLYSPQILEAIFSAILTREESIVANGLPIFCQICDGCEMDSESIIRYSNHFFIEASAFPKNAYLYIDCLSSLIKSDAYVLTRFDFYDLFMKAVSSFSDPLLKESGIEAISIYFSAYDPDSQECLKLLLCSEDITSSVIYGVRVIMKKATHSIGIDAFLFEIASMLESSDADFIDQSFRLFSLVMNKKYDIHSEIIDKIIKFAKEHIDEEEIGDICINELVDLTIYRILDPDHIYLVIYANLIASKPNILDYFISMSRLLKSNIHIHYDIVVEMNEFATNILRKSIEWPKEIVKFISTIALKMPELIQISQYLSDSHTSQSSRILASFFRVDLSYEMKKEIFNFIYQSTQDCSKFENPLSLKGLAKICKKDPQLFNERRSEIVALAHSIIFNHDSKMQTFSKIEKAAVFLDLIAEDEGYIPLMQISPFIFDYPNSVDVLITKYPKFPNDLIIPLLAYIYLHRARFHLSKCTTEAILAKIE